MVLALGRHEFAVGQPALHDGRGHVGAGVGQAVLHHLVEVVIETVDGLLPESGCGFGGDGLRAAFGDDVGVVPAEGLLGEPLEQGEVALGHVHHLHDHAERVVVSEVRDRVTAAAGADEVLDGVLRQLAEGVLVLADCLNRERVGLGGAVAGMVGRVHGGEVVDGAGDPTTHHVAQVGVALLRDEHEVLVATVVGLEVLEDFADVTVLADDPHRVVAIDVASADGHVLAKPGSCGINDVVYPVPVVGGHDDAGDVVGDA